jgi:outer membrane protein
MKTWMARVTAAAAVGLAAAAPLNAQNLQTAQNAQTVQHLSLKEAETMAVENHPQIRAGEYAALAGGEVVRQIRSVYFPSVQGSVTGAQAGDGSRIAAGGLNNPIILDRFAYGFSVSQLLTDFGRTSQLTSSASLRVDAQNEDVAARRADVMLQVDRAYFTALRTRAIQRVAQQTVAARQLVVDQVTSLATAGIKSTLDLSFAKVNLSEAQLLLIQATNDVRSADAVLSAALGSPQSTAYDLADEPLPAAPSADNRTLLAEALTDRPDVAGERLTRQSAERFAAAERALWFPTLSVIAAGGMTPLHGTGLTDRYSAAGVNITFPLSNGNLFSARRAEALHRLSLEQERLRDLENRVTRDVQVAWLDAQTAYQRIDLANQLFAQAADASDLAQQRYNLGLSSIVELTQAQLNQTRAEIEQATARYDYQTKEAALRFQTGSLK